MAQRITTPNLAMQLDRVFRVSGGVRGPNDIETVAPAQPVYDIMRTAELSRIVTDPGAGGLFQVGQDQVHAGAGVIEDVVDPYAALDASWGVIGQRWIWLFRFGVTLSASVIVSARLTASIAALGNALALRDFLLATYDAQLAINGSGAHDLAGVLVNATTNNQLPDPGTILPFPLPPGSTLNCRSQASGIGTIRFSTICWVGPFGVYPPGLR